MNTAESCEYIENILLEILDRPNVWLQKGESNKFNIGTFNAQKAALAFLQQYQKITFVKAEKIVLFYNNEKLHLVVRSLTYGNIDKNLTKIPNTTIEFIYRQISFCEIKWSKIIINTEKQSVDTMPSEELNQTNTTETISRLISNEFDNHLMSVSPSQLREYESITNLDQINPNEIVSSEDINHQNSHFRSTVFIRLN